LIPYFALERAIRTIIILQRGWISPFLRAGVCVGSLSSDWEALLVADSSVGPDADEALNRGSGGVAKIVSDHILGIHSRVQLADVERAQLGRACGGRGAYLIAQSLGTRQTDAIDLRERNPKALVLREPNAQKA
jgi:hypothetical protein